MRIASPIRHPPSPIRHLTPLRPKRDIPAYGDSRRNPPPSTNTYVPQTRAKNPDPRSQPRVVSFTNGSYWTESRRSGRSEGDLRNQLSSAQSRRYDPQPDLRDRLNSQRINPTWNEDISYT